MRPFVDRPLVYVAGPYTNPDPVQNTHDTIQAAEALQDTELVTCVVPHMTLLWHLVSPHEYGHWLDWDMATLARCDALYRLPGKSSGADGEVAFARRRGIPTFYARGEQDNNVVALLKWARLIIGHAQSSQVFSASSLPAICPPDRTKRRAAVSDPPQ